MARVLVTGMSGAGKSTLLAAVAERGYLAVDTDYDGWELPGSVWDEPRMSALLAGHPTVAVSGTPRTRAASTTGSSTWSTSSSPSRCCWNGCAGAPATGTAGPLVSRRTSPGTSGRAVVAFGTQICVGGMMCPGGR